MRTLTRQLYRFMCDYGISPNMLILLVVIGVVISYRFAA